MKSSKWSCSSARSSKLSRTSSRGSGRSTRSRVKAGTQRRVTAEIAPRAPTPTRAARSRSASAPAVSSRTLPSARTSSIASTWEEMLRSFAPVPWVPVEIAPAIVWRSMSPRFSIASPSAVQRLVQLGEDRPAPHPDQAGAGVGVDHAAERRDVDHRAVGHRRLGEGVAAALDADRPAGGGGGGNRRRELFAIAGAEQLRRPAGLVPRPVAPLAHGVSLARYPTAVLGADAGSPRRAYAAVQSSSAATAMLGAA